MNMFSNVFALLVKGITLYSMSLTYQINHLSMDA